MTIQIEKSQLLTYGLPVIIIISSVFLALSPWLKINPDLATGITYDLTLTAPLVYFLLIWKKKSPLIAVVPFFVLGIVLATLVLPKHQQNHLDLIKIYVLPIVELIVFFVIFYHIYKTIKAFKAASDKTYDFYNILKESAVKVIGFPVIAKILACEIAMVYYAFFSLRKAPTLDKGFTNYKENGVTALLAIILFILIVESCIVHLLLIKWNETVAWILFSGSLYAVVQIFGHLKAIRQRTSELIGNQLYLKYGLFGDVKIDLTNISRIELTHNKIEDEDRKVEKLALLKEIESYNVVIYLTKKHKIEKAFGITKECDTLLFHIDNKKEFVQIINNALHQQA